MIMSTLNWVYEPKAATPPFQRTSTRQLHGCERHARWADSSGRGVGADDMDDEECLDAWARCLDSTFLSRLYGVKRYEYGTAKALPMKARDDTRIAVVRTACRGTSSAGRRTWVIGETTETRLSTRISR
jgi:hypothetical protein